MSFTIIHEQRVNLKFLVKLGKRGKDALEMLRAVYGPDTMGKARFYDWYKRFKEGREDVTDEPRCGRPVTVNTPENVKAVEDAVRANEGLSLRKVSAMTKVNKETVRQIMKDQLKIKFASPIKKEATQKRSRKRKVETPVRQTPQFNEGPGSAQSESSQSQASNEPQDYNDQYFSTDEDYQNQIDQLGSTYMGEPYKRRKADTSELRAYRVDQ